MKPQSKFRGLCICKCLLIAIVQICWMELIISLEATTGTTISAGKIRKKVSNAEQTNRDRKGYVNSDCG